MGSKSRISRPRKLITLAKLRNCQIWGPLSLAKVINSGIQGVFPIFPWLAHENGGQKSGFPASEDLSEPHLGSLWPMKMEAKSWDFPPRRPSRNPISGSPWFPSKWDLQKEGFSQKTADFPVWGARKPRNPLFSCLGGPLGTPFQDPLDLPVNGTTRKWGVCSDRQQRAD